MFTVDIRHSKNFSGSLNAVQKDRVCDDNGGGFTVLSVTVQKVNMGAKIRYRYNQVPHLTKDTNGKVKLTVTHHKREPRGQPFPSR